MERMDINEFMLRDPSIGLEEEIRRRFHSTIDPGGYPLELFKDPKHAEPYLCAMLSTFHGNEGCLNLMFVLSDPFQCIDAKMS